MKMGKPVYKLAVCLALATPLLLAWMIGAVGVLGREGDPADWMYIGVFAVAIICAVAARFRPAGMARALFATALAQALVAVIALIAGVAPRAVYVRTRNPWIQRILHRAMDHIGAAVPVRRAGTVSGRGRNGCLSENFIEKAGRRANRWAGAQQKRSCSTWTRRLFSKNPSR